MKKKITKKIALLILTILLTLNMSTAMAEGQYFNGVRSVLDGNTKLSDDENKAINNTITDLSSEDNACIKLNEMNQITAVIEEPLDFVGTEESGMRDCVRVTICASRAAIGKGTECVTLLNKADITKPEINTDFFTVTYNPVQVFMSQSGVEILYAYIGAIYRWGASIIGVIAVLVIVISGIQISAAGGEQGAVTSAKTRITQSLIGIVVLFLSGIILYTINPTFFTATIPKAEQTKSTN